MMVRGTMRTRTSVTDLFFNRFGEDHEIGFHDVRTDGEHDHPPKSMAARMANTILRSCSLS